MAAVGFVAVLLLPTAASGLPWGDRPQPNEAQLAVTAVGVVVLTAVYLLAVSRDRGLSRAWTVWTFGYTSSIIAVKFVLSPAVYFGGSQRTSLPGYVGVGVGVLVLYATAVFAVYALASRTRSLPSWKRPANVSLVVVLVLAAFASRFVVALVLGRDGSAYLRQVFTSSGPWLALLIVVAASLAMVSFDRATHGSKGGALDPAFGLRTSLAVGLALLVLYHGWWVAFMVRLS